MAVDIGEGGWRGDHPSPLIPEEECPTGTTGDQVDIAVTVNVERQNCVRSREACEGLWRVENSKPVVVQDRNAFSLVGHSDVEMPVAVEVRRGELVWGARPKFPLDRFARGIMDRRCKSGFTGVAKDLDVIRHANSAPEISPNDLFVRVTTSGEVTQFVLWPALTVTVGRPIFGPDGNLWFAVKEQGKVYRFTTSGTLLPPIITAEWPEQLTVGPDGTVWATHLSDRVSRIAGDGSVLSYTMPPGNGPAGIGSTPDGAIWIPLTAAPWCSYTLRRIAPDGTVTDSYTGVCVAGKSSVIVGPHDTLWYSGDSSWSLTRVSDTGEITAFPTSEPSYKKLVAGPDGNIWFLGYRQLVRVNGEDGVETRFDLPVELASDFTVGPDGRFWIIADRQLLRVTAPPSPTPVPRPTARGPRAYISQFLASVIQVIDVLTNQIVDTIKVTYPAWTLSDIEVAPDGHYLYGVVGPRIQVYDTLTDTLVRTLPLAAQAMTIAPNGKTAYVISGFQQDGVFVLDMDTMTVTDFLPLSYPSYITFSPDSATAYVSSPSNGEVVVVDVARGAPVGVIAIQNPGPVVVNHAGTEAYVAANFDEIYHSAAGFAVLDLTTQEVKQRIPQYRPGHMVFSSDDRYVYALRPGLERIDTATLDVTYQGTGASDLALSADGRLLYALDFDSLKVIDTDSLSVVREVRGTPVSPLELILSPMAHDIPVPQLCAGDCSLDGQVTIDEILVAVNMALGNSPASGCVPVDSNGDQQITVDEILRAVAAALNGCA